MKHAHIFQAKLKTPNPGRNFFGFFRAQNNHITSHAARTLENVVYNIVLYVHVCTYVYVY